MKASPVSTVAIDVVDREHTGDREVENLPASTVHPGRERRVNCQHRLPSLARSNLHITTNHVEHYTDTWLHLYIYLSNKESETRERRSM